jgi:hypothetical protein
MRTASGPSVQNCSVENGRKFLAPIGSVSPILRTEFSREDRLRGESQPGRPAHALCQSACFVFRQQGLEGQLPLTSLDDNELMGRDERHLLFPDVLVSEKVSKSEPHGNRGEHG